MQSGAGYGASQICVFNILSRKHFWPGALEGGVKLTECQVLGCLLTAAGGGGTHLGVWRRVTTVASGCQRLQHCGPKARWHRGEHIGHGHLQVAQKHPFLSNDGRGFLGPAAQPGLGQLSPG